MECVNVIYNFKTFLKVFFLITLILLPVFTHQVILKNEWYELIYADDSYKLIHPASAWSELSRENIC